MNNTIKLPGDDPLFKGDEQPNTVPLGSTLLPLTMRKPSEILAMPFSDDANILGDYMIAMEQGGTIVGPPGCGKSRLIFQCAADTIRGKDFLIFPTRAPKQRWVIFNTENSNRRLKADLQRLKNYCGDDWPVVDEHLIIHTLETEDDGFVSLKNPVNAMRIEEVIRDLNPLVNVFDPLSEYRVADLNNDDNMLATCKELGRLSKAGNPKRATTILHHTVVGRAGAMKAVGYDRGAYGRNSKALLGWARSQFNLAPGNPDNNDVLIVSCGKCSNGIEFAPFAIRLNPATMIYEVDRGFDLDGWLAEYGGQTAKEPLVTVEGVQELCQGGKIMADLAKAIKARGVSHQHAYRLIHKAEKAKKIHYTKATDRYVPAT